MQTPTRKPDSSHVALSAPFDLLEGFSAEQAALLRSKLTAISIKSGALFIHVGEPGDCLYVIRAGEVEVTTPQSVAGGGRYDKIIGGYLGGKRESPATGFSFGLDTIVEVLKLERKLEVKSLIQLYVIPIGTPKESFQVTQQLREAKIRCDIDLNGRGISKNLDYANTLGIPYVLFVGEDELKAGKFKLKNMKEGSEEMLTLEDVKKKLEKP